MIVFGFCIFVLLFFDFTYFRLILSLEQNNQLSNNSITKIFKRGVSASRLLSELSIIWLIETLGKRKKIPNSTRIV